MPNYPQNVHPSEQDFRLLAAGRLDIGRKETMLAHTALCSRCALKLAEAYESGCLFSPPASFLEDTLRRLGFEGETKAPKASRKRFYAYCLRVGFAACASLMLLYSGVFNLIPSSIQTAPFQTEGRAYTQLITDGMRTFSDNLIKLEVFKRGQ